MIIIWGGGIGRVSAGNFFSGLEQAVVSPSTLQLCTVIFLFFFFS